MFYPKLSIIHISFASNCLKEVFKKKFTTNIPLNYCKRFSTAVKENTTIREIPLCKNQNDTETKTRNRSTVNENQLEKFRHIASSWWDPEKEFKPLHSLNKLRISLIRDGLIQLGSINLETAKGPKPLQGVKLLDVGCGGGILCEPLARLGATVVGLDVVEQSLSVAKIHAQKDKLLEHNLSYISGTIEDHAAEVQEQYDGVIASEVIEHVESVEMFLDSCAGVLKPGGSLFLTTINRTRRSWLGAIILGEYVLRLLPEGAHDWNKFITPNELISMLKDVGCSPRLVHGMGYIPFRNEWFWCPDTSINYAIHAIKRRHPTK